jgi:hypothetical protein
MLAAIQAYLCGSHLCTMECHNMAAMLHVFAIMHFQKH